MEMKNKSEPDRVRSILNRSVFISGVSCVGCFSRVGGVNLSCGWSAAAERIRRVIQNQSPEGKTHSAETWRTLRWNWVGRRRRDEGEPLQRHTNTTNSEKPERRRKGDAETAAAFQEEEEEEEGETWPPWPPGKRLWPILSSRLPLRLQSDGNIFRLLPLKGKQTN